MSSNLIVNSFWQGRLSTLQKLSLNSYLAHGHQLHLYSYYKIPDLPPGVVLKDAGEILPPERIFVYRKGPGKGSIAGFSDLFRYVLLFKKGGWWTDLDVVCLKFYNFSRDIVLCSQKHRTRHFKVFPVVDNKYVTTNVMKCPVKWDLIRYCLQAIEKTDLTKIQWGKIGPDLLNHAVRKYQATHYVEAYKVFNPVPWYDIRQFFLPSLPGENTYSIHLYANMWQRAGLDPDGHYPADCLYVRLRQAYR
jgi:hypothetical protein